MRRQTWLQKNQALHVVNTYAEAMSGGKGNKHTTTEYDSGIMVPPDELFNIMGIEIKYA